VTGAAAAGPASAATDLAWAPFGAAGDILRRVVASGRTAPAYLFEGLDLSLARRAARVFAAALLCRAKSPPCGECSSCRRVASGSHPDLHLQGRDKATVISVDALAALLERAHMSPLEGDRQVFVVEPADALAPEAVARYLKTLEEPPRSTVFVLVTARPDRLPDTVRSRCQRLRFPSPPEAGIAASLVAGGLDEARASRVARLSGGSTARASRIAALALDAAADGITRAALGAVPAAATDAERGLSDLRARLAESGEPTGPDAEPSPGEGPAAGEALREALADLFHVLVTLARDRAAGLDGGPLAEVSPSAAAAVLPEWGRLASLVRRNLSPVSLWIEAVAVLARSAGT